MPSSLLKSLRPPLCGLILVTGLLLPCVRPQAAELEQQRQQFLDAGKALQDGAISRFTTLTESLKNYPLYPYLLYQYLRPRLWKAKDSEITDFLLQYGDMPAARDLRETWLLILAKRGRWQTYLDNYTPQDDPVLQCYQLLARIKTGNTARLPEDARDLWLTGHSMPSQCDPAFKLLYQSKLMTPSLVWERIRRAMEQGQTRLAKYLGRRLDKEERHWVARWVDMYHNPAWGLQHKSAYPDGPRAREILVYGIRRLATANIDRAIKRWEALRSQYSFSPEDRLSMRRTLAVYAVINDNDKARALLDSLGDDHMDEDVFQWRLLLALTDHDWKDLVRWTRGTPPDDAVRLRWQYWRARALEQTGDKPDADAIYRSLAEERDYYGFLAADRLGVNYNLNYLSVPKDDDAWKEVMSMPAVLRARELYSLDRLYSARREWHYAIAHMDKYQMQIAAMIASDWGWHDRTILTLGRAKALDDLVLRFPLSYEQRLKEYADKRGLDISWVFALTRAESAFMEDARSVTGALGLMQVMPNTGKRTARAIGFRKFHTRYLLDADKNITIGTAYLKQMYDKFDGNKILATAAYNAGPNNIVKWLPDSGCEEPDEWIEKIPYTETRKYVARILYYSTIYDWRLHRGITPVHDRMAVIEPQRKNLITDLNCVVTNVSDNSR